MVAPNRFKICVTRALESPSRRAIAAREATSPVSSWRSQSRARFRGSCRSRVMPRSADFLAAAKFTITHDAKFFACGAVGEQTSQAFGFGDRQPPTEERTRHVLHGQDQHGREVTLQLLEIVDVGRVDDAAAPQALLTRWWVRVKSSSGTAA